MSNFSLTYPDSRAIRAFDRAKSFSERLSRVFHQSRKSISQQRSMLEPEPSPEHISGPNNLYPPTSAFSMPYSAGECSIFNPTKPTNFRFLETISGASSPVLVSSIFRPRSGLGEHEPETEADMRNSELTRPLQEALETQGQHEHHDDKEPHKHPKNEDGPKCDHDETIAALKKEIIRLKADMKTLEVREAKNAKNLTTVLKSNSEQVNVNLSQQLTMIKEALTNEISSFVAESMRKNSAENRELITSIYLLLEMLERQITITEMSDSFTTSLEENIGALRSNSEKRFAEIMRQSESTAQSVSQNSSTQGSSLNISKKKQQYEREKALEIVKQKQLKNEQQKQSLLDQIAVIDFKIEQSKMAANQGVNIMPEPEEGTRTSTEEYAFLEAERRLLHNKLQQLKGNIRVFCRVRPSSDPDMSLVSMSLSASEDVDNVGKEVLTLGSITHHSNLGVLPSCGSSVRHSAKSRQPIHKFMFDKVFPPQSDNSEIFSEISQFVQSSLDGFNVCVFAYGQTGSGKTWTMSHKDDGMIPLSINKIFSDIKELMEKGWEYTVDGQFVEIYNESIVDLLGEGSKTTRPEIKHDVIARKTIITNCTIVRLESQAHAIVILEKANQNRSTASTMSNIRSSRSHSAFILNIRGTHRMSGQSCDGTLNLVDLAGLNVSVTRRKGQALEGTQAINRSLSRSKIYGH
ncbi:hypothetical protein JCM33374_g5472 [Metschnikowia sp. JCM 33374]|nr:hypothetical protein JCM33374_g5472 [Metschnikowia sp. JCM 33374]